MRDQQAEARGARVIDDIGQQCCTEPATLQIGADADAADPKQTLASA